MTITNSLPSNLKLWLIRIFLIAFGFVFTQSLSSQGTNLIEIRGTVTDQKSNAPITSVSVQIKGASGGTTTDSSGKFALRAKTSFPLTLVFSSIGFQQQEFDVTSFESNLNIALVTQSVIGKAVVVTATRVANNSITSPVAVERLDIRAIRESPAPGFYDALENVKGVQMTTSSLTFKVPNTRGFNIPNNFRFMQMVDGIDMQAATLGVPLGNAIGPTELDIASVEITPGAASALYGMNAINGMANLITKNPFLYEGLSVYQKIGINHVDGIDHNAAVLHETAIRYAKAYKKLAFKINGSYMRGTDWRSNTRIDQNPNTLKSANPNYAELNGANNVAYDAWNKYGDDALAGSNLVSISGLTIKGVANQTLRVARTGYWEKDLVDPTVDNLKLDASVHYKLNAKSVLSYTYRVGKMDGVFQRGNKIQLDNVVVQNHSLELKGSNYTIRSYVSLENTGDSYNVKPLADNIDLASGGTNAAWAAKYKIALLNQLDAGAEFSAANKAARTAADASRVVPGTAAFDQLKNTIIRLNNWDIRSATNPDAPITGGAALIQNSRLYHTEAQWDLSKKIKVFDLLLGADVRVYEIIPDGNNFVDFNRAITDRNKPLADGSFGDNIYYKKMGAFAQITKSLLQAKLKIFGSVRYDYNPEFNPRITPRIAAVYTANRKHYFRVTYQQGYRFPVLFEALSYVNNGGVKRVGSLSYINNGLGYLENSYTQSSVINYNAAASAAGNSDAAALQNRNLLQVAALPEAKPERINSFEVGYKSVLFDNKLVIDVDVYSNTYTGFLGQVQVFVPKNEKVGSDAAVLAMLDRNRNATLASGNTAASNGQERYRVYTNAKNAYRNYGSALGVTYSFKKTFTLRGNVSYNKMKANSTSDVFVTGFNTPAWSTNLSFGNRAIIKNVGFNVAWKWQDAFLWESPLATGDISSYSVFDAQLTYRLPKANTSIKLGGSNIFNKRYLQYAGGPTIGGLYYLSLSFENLLKNNSNR